MMEVVSVKTVVTAGVVGEFVAVEALVVSIVVVAVAVALELLVDGQVAAFVVVGRRRAIA